MTTTGEFSLEEKVNLLLKKHFGKPSTRNELAFFSEPGGGFAPILATQVWQEAGDIPDDAPIDLVGGGPSGTINDLTYPLLGSNGTDINDNRFGLTSTSDPVVALFVNISTTYVSGTTYTFRAAADPNGDYPLVDAIPFNFGPNGKYNFLLRDADGVKVNFGSSGGHWVVDTANGYITFFHTIDGAFNIDGSNTPTISFFKYVGLKGVGLASATAGVTVAETDGSPALSNSTTIQFNSEHANFVVSQNGSNVVDIDLQPTSFAVGSTYGSTKPSSNNMIVEGSVGIGTNNPEQPLHVNGLIWSGGAIGASDRRWKTNFNPLENPLLSIGKIRGLYFDWNDTAKEKMNFTEDKQIGVIAQEVEAVYPELVITNKSGYKSVAYDKLTAVLVECVKDLTSKYNEQSSQMNELKESFDNYVESKENQKIFWLF